MLIEHVMELVMNISQRSSSSTTVKNRRRPPQDIAKNPQVIKAYLGERYVRERTACKCANFGVTGDSHPKDDCADP